MMSCFDKTGTPTSVVWKLRFSSHRFANVLTIIDGRMGSMGTAPNWYQRENPVNTDLEA